MRQDLLLTILLTSSLMFALIVMFSRNTATASEEVADVAGEGDQEKKGMKLLEYKVEDLKEKIEEKQEEFKEQQEKIASGKLSEEESKKIIEQMQEEHVMIEEEFKKLNADEQWRKNRDYWVQKVMLEQKLKDMNAALKEMERLDKDRKDKILYIDDKPANQELFAFSHPAINFP